MEKILQDWSNRMHMSVSIDEISRMIDHSKPLRDETLAKEYLKHEINKMCVFFYGKQQDQQAIKMLIKEISSNLSHLSCNDLNLCFRRISENKTGIDEYFSASKIMGVLNKYSVMRSKIRTRYFELKREENQTEQDKQNAFTFLKESLAKLNNGEELNVYEKSVIGKHHMEDQPEAAEIMEMAKNLMPKKQKELSQIQTARTESIDFAMVGGFKPLEETGDEPLFWTESLLYGFMLFENMKLSA